MSRNQKQSQKGFTIIEVVLVLAIAGLIFMMVFIALPALQRSQRDTQRKNDLARAVTAIENYTSANNGALPTNWTTFETSYLTVGGDSFIDPAGASTTNSSSTYYVFSSSTSQLTGSFSSATQNTIYYSIGRVCNTSDSTNVTSAGSRKVALRMYLESGGVACENN